ncbi:MAG: tail fiber domain-containing protein [Bacteroidota bacterium]
MKNKNTLIYGFAFIVALLLISNKKVNAQSWNLTGNAGTTAGTNFIGTTDAKDFVFKTNNTEKGRVKSNGLWQFGASINLAKIDSGGNLSFSGTAAYKVAANKYAFQYAGNPNYGLFFNSTNLLYEFRTSTALSVFSIGANTGNGIFKGNLKIGAYTLPATDGASGQVLKSNGAGVLSWSNDNGTSYSAGTGITFAGSVINSNWTATGSDIYNNNSGTVGIGAAPYQLTYKMNLICNGLGGMFISDPVDGYILNCTKSGTGYGIYIDNTSIYSGLSAIEAHVNGSNYAIEGYSDVYNSVGLLGGQNGVYGQSSVGNGVVGASSSGIGVSAVSNTGIGLSASSTSAFAVLGNSSAQLGNYFSTTFEGGPSGWGGTAFALVGEYQGTGNNDGVAVYGLATSTAANYGFGGFFVGNYVGVMGKGNAGASYAVYANASGATYGIYCNGNFAGTGVNSYSSDAKLKKNVQPIGSALDNIMKLKPSSYEFKVGEFGDLFLPSGNHYGVIAQDLQKVFPELVTENKFYNNDKSELDYLAVNYQELTPILIAAMQEQQKTIEDLKSQLQQFDQSLSECCLNHNTGTTNQTTISDAPKLEQNSPNPFSQNTVIKYYLPLTAKSGVIKIYSLEGLEMKSFSISQNGFGQITVTGSSLTSGVYVYTLIIDGKAIDTKQMILTKN